MVREYPVRTQRRLAKADRRVFVVQIYNALLAEPYGGRMPLSPMPPLVSASGSLVRYLYSLLARQDIKIAQSLSTFAYRACAHGMSASENMTVSFIAVHGY